MSDDPLGFGDGEAHLFRYSEVADTTLGPESEDDYVASYDSEGRRLDSINNFDRRASAPEALESEGNTMTSEGASDADSSFCGWFAWTERKLDAEIGL